MTNTELDALIAERVMGWSARHGYWINEQNGFAAKYNMAEDLATPHWHPTEDISQAMQAVDAMADLGWWLALQNVVPNSDPLVWRAILHRGILGNDDRHESDYEDTPALAICKAIASAIEGKL